MSRNFGLESFYSEFSIDMAQKYGKNSQCSSICETSANISTGELFRAVDGAWGESMTIKDEHILVGVRWAVRQVLFIFLNLNNYLLISSIALPPCDGQT